MIRNGVIVAVAAALLMAPAFADPFCDGVNAALRAPLGFEAYRIGAASMQDDGSKYWALSVTLSGATHCAVHSYADGSDGLDCDFPAKKWMDKDTINALGDAVAACVPGAKLLPAYDSTGLRTYEVPTPAGRSPATIAISARMLATATLMSISRKD
ncbi:MAG: hypothetical protein KGJ78_16325 [Alphaproteobacteria bacterium]|nr:hypothetical protein [Alphaproteobacteria bacterium]